MGGISLVKESHHISVTKMWQLCMLQEDQMKSGDRLACNQWVVVLVTHCKKDLPLP